MSVLEIIIYSCLGIAFIGWLIYELATFKKKKNKKESNEDED